MIKMNIMCKILGIITFGIAFVLALLTGAEYWQAMITAVCFGLFCMVLSLTNK